MRAALLLVALLGLFGCGDDDAPGDKANSRPDSGTASTGSKLERPGIARPPSDGLPDDLRPPRD